MGSIRVESREDRDRLHDYLYKRIKGGSGGDAVSSGGAPPNCYVSDRTLSDSAIARIAANLGIAKPAKDRAARDGKPVMADPYIRDATEYVRPRTSAEHDALGKRIQTSEIEARRIGDHEWKRNLDKLRARWIADMPSETKYAKDRAARDVEPVKVGDASEKEYLAELKEMYGDRDPRYLNERKRLREQNAPIIAERKAMYGEKDPRVRKPAKDRAALHRALDAVLDGIAAKGGR